MELQTEINPAAHIVETFSPSVDYGQTRSILIFRRDIGPTLKLC